MLQTSVKVIALAVVFSAGSVIFFIVGIIAAVSVVKDKYRRRQETIMKGNGKSKINTLLSIAVLIAVIGCAVLLGACGSAVNQDNAGGDQNGGTADLEGNIPADTGDPGNSNTIKFEGRMISPRLSKSGLPII